MMFIKALISYSQGFTETKGHGEFRASGGEVNVSGGLGFVLKGNTLDSYSHQKDFINPNSPICG